MAFDLQAIGRQAIGRQEIGREVGPAGAQDHGIAPLADAEVR